MDRIPVRSSNIRAIGYENNVLEVEFHSGGVYQYYGVPEVIYKELMQAVSKGFYFHNHIKGRYTYRKMG